MESQGRSIAALGKHGIAKRPLNDSANLLQRPVESTADSDR